MNIGIYVGSFDPFHIGHREVVIKAEHMFDNVIIGVGINPEKQHSTDISKRVKKIKKQFPFYEVYTFWNIFEFYSQMCAKHPFDKITIIRGVRDFNDLDSNYIEILHDNNINCVLIKTPNEFQHISSGAIREMKRIGEGHRVEFWEPFEKKVIGIVGKICSGKSTYRKTLDSVFEEHLSIDIDMLVKSETNIFYEKNGLNLNNEQLKRYLFSDSELMKAMIALTKPFVSKRIRTQILYCDRRCSNIVVIEDPMMIEQNRVDLYDEIHYIECDDEEILKRLVEKRKLTLEEAKHRLSYFSNTILSNIPSQKLKIIRS